MTPPGLPASNARERLFTDACSFKAVQGYVYDKL